MKNISVKSKLLVSFSIMILLAVIVGSVGIVGMSSINSADDALYNNNLIGVSSMSALCETLQRERVELRNVALNGGDPDKVREIWASMSALEQSMSENFAKYEGTIIDDSAEQAYYNAKKIYQADFKTFKQQVYDASLVSSAEPYAIIFSDEMAVMTDTMLNAFTTSLQNNDKWARQSVDDNTSLFIRMAIIEVIMLVVAIAAALFLAFYISGLISTPLKVLTTFMNKAGSAGDIRLRPEDVETISRMSMNKDEIGQCVGSTASFIDHMAEISKHLEIVADGDLSTTIKELSPDDIMGVSLNKMIENLHSMFGELKMSSDQVSSGSAQVSQSAQELATGSSEQAASVQELTAAVSMVKEQVGENAKRSQRVLENCDTAVNLMSVSLKSMGEMTEAMDSIDESSKNITRVIKVIDDIAFQTNILALNAAVEAARAGQHGKGFAVVADEVRNLAAKSAEAAKETASLIEGSSQRVAEGSKIVEQTNESLQAVGVTTNENVELIREITKSLEKQSASVLEINQGMDQISAVVQANSATAEQSAAAAEEMSAQSAVMDEIVANFKLSQESQSGLQIADQNGTKFQSKSTGFAMTGSNSNRKHSMASR